MRFTNADDLYRAFNNSVVSFNNTSYYVQTAGLAMQLFSFDDNFSLSLNPKKNINCAAEISWRLPKLGFYPHLVGGNLIYSTRSNKRQWVVGLNNKNVLHVSVTKRGLEAVQFHLLTSDGAKLLNSSYNPLKVVVSEGGGLSHNFGILGSTLFHKTIPIGRVIDEKQVLINKEYLNSLLEEDLKDLGFKMIGETDEDL